MLYKCVAYYLRCVYLRGAAYDPFTAHSLRGWSFQGFYRAFDNIVKCAILTRFQWVTKSVKSKFSRKGLWKIYDAWSECHLLQILPRVQSRPAEIEAHKLSIFLYQDKLKQSILWFKWGGADSIPIPTHSNSLLTFQTWGGSCYNKARKLDDISWDMGLIWTHQVEVSPIRYYLDLIWCFDGSSRNVLKTQALLMF
mgnify:FL=1